MEPRVIRESEATVIEDAGIGFGMLGEDLFLRNSVFPDYAALHPSYKRTLGFATAQPNLRPPYDLNRDDPPLVAPGWGIVHPTQRFVHHR